MSEVKRVFKDLFIRPEKTFKTMGTRAMAYVILYILPFIIFSSIMASSIFYGYAVLIILTPIVFGSLYLFGLAWVYLGTRQTRELKIASEQVVPDKLISYFKKQYPNSNLPMMLSADRQHWVAYGHIDKNRMARVMTFAEYHLMKPPPRLTNFFLDHTGDIKYQYLIIEDPDREVFRITDSPPEKSVYYPVTVFDKERIS